MAANDLKQPLGLEKGKRALTRFRISQLFMFGSLAVFVALISSLIGWIALVDDPHGGYPSEVVDLRGVLDKSNRIGVESIRPGIKPGIPETNAPSFPNNAQTDNDFATTLGDTDDAGEIKILSPDDPSLNSLPGTNKQAAYLVNARSINSDAIAGLPKIAIIVDGLGLSQTTTQEALSLLPPDVSLAFAPYGNSLQRWTRKARSQGHELLIQVPMEPFDYPNNDPGPHTLLTTNDTAKNLSNLNWVLGRFDGYVGIMNYMGARFSSDELVGTDLMRQLAGNGLLYVENGASGRSRLNSIARSLNVPNLRADLIVDVRGRSEDIQTRLVQLESLAQERGHALGVATAFPVSVRTISEWTQSLRQRGFALVPVTTLLQQ